MEYIEVISNSILPLFIFVIIGFLMDRKFKIDLNTYNKITIYVVLPCFVFYSICSAQLAPEMLTVLEAGIVLIAVQWLIGGIIARLRHFDGGKTEVFRTGVSMTNAVNIGLILISMIFSHGIYKTGDATPYLPEALGTMTVLLVLMNIAMNTAGSYLIGKGHLSVRESAKILFRMPTFYTVCAALAVKAAGIDITSTFVWPVFYHFSSAVIVLVLTTLGIQIHRTRFDWSDKDIWIGSFCRLVISPAAAVAIVCLFGGFTPITSQVFFIYAAMPSAVNTVLYAVEFRNHPDFATQLVLACTMLSAVTLSIAIYAAPFLFPL